MQTPKPSNGSHHPSHQKPAAQPPLEALRQGFISLDFSSDEFDTFYDYAVKNNLVDVIEPFIAKAEADEDYMEAARDYLRTNGPMADEQLRNALQSLKESPHPSPQEYKKAPSAEAKKSKAGATANTAQAISKHLKHLHKTAVSRKNFALSGEIESVVTLWNGIATLEDQQLIGQLTINKITGNWKESEADMFVGLLSLTLTAYATRNFYECLRTHKRILQRQSRLAAGSPFESSLEQQIQAFSSMQNEVATFNNSTLEYAPAVAPDPSSAASSRLCSTAATIVALPPHPESASLRNLSSSSSSASSLSAEPSAPPLQAAPALSVAMQYIDSNAALSSGSAAARSSTPASSSVSSLPS